MTDSGSPLGAEGALTDVRSVSILPDTSILTFESLPVSDLTLELDPDAHLDR